MTPPAFSPTSHVPAATERPVSVGNWLVTLIVLAIPLVGLIMALVWAFSDNTPPSKRNYCKAALILILIAIVLFGALVFLGGGLAAVQNAMQRAQSIQFPPLRAR